MNDENIAAAKCIPSFLIESLVWNVPIPKFGHDTLTDDVRESLIFLYNNTDKIENCKSWCEVNHIKYLFHSSQSWTFQQARAFVLEVWNYLGLQ